MDLRTIICYIMNSVFELLHLEFISTELHNINVHGPHEVYMVRF